MAKRKTAGDDESGSELDWEELIAQFEANGGESTSGADLVNLVQDVLNTLKAKRQKTTLSSFSHVLWKDVAPKFGLQESASWNQFDHFQVPKAILPPSFHRKLLRDAVQWLDVYQERDSQDNEAARLRLMEAWHVPVCALFKGRIIDRPEVNMPQTKETSGGRAEHQLYMDYGILVLVHELNFEYKSKRDNFAEVMVSLASAYNANSEFDFDPQPPVYAILTDIQEFQFISFNGSRFSCTAPIIIPSQPREAFMEGMMAVTEQFFSILLHAYIGVVSAVESRSRARAEKGDISTHSSAAQGDEILQESGSLMSSRPSFEKWSRALLKAVSSQEAFSQCKNLSIDQREVNGTLGLTLLTESVNQLDVIGTPSALNTKDLDDEIENMITRYCSPNTQ